MAGSELTQPSTSGGAVTSVASRTGAVVLTATDISGLVALDTTDTPQPLGTATPGTGTGGAAPRDHVHAMPATTSLSDQDATKLADGTLMRWSATAGKFIQVPESLVGFLPNGELTMDTDTATGDSGSFSQTPASGVCLWSYFIAKRSWAAMKYITLSTAGTAAATPSGIGAKFGLYSVASNGDLTLMDSTASITGGLTGTYTTKKVALAGGAQNITAGNVYAIGVIQIGTTSGSTIGAWQQILGSISNVGGVRRASSKSGLTDLPSTQVDSGLSTPGWRLFATVTTS